MTVGIVGAGQLGRMMALAGYPLGLDFLFLDRDARTPGGQVAPDPRRRAHRPQVVRQAVASAARSSPSTGKTSRSRRWQTCRARRASRRRCARSPPRRTGSARSAPSSCSVSRPRAMPRSIRAHALELAVDSPSACPACSRRAAWATTARASSCCANPRTSTPPGLRSARRRCCTKTWCRSSARSR